MSTESGEVEAAEKDVRARLEDASSEEKITTEADFSKTLIGTKTSLLCSSQGVDSEIELRNTFPRLRGDILGSRAVHGLRGPLIHQTPIFKSNLTFNTRRSLDVNHGQCSFRNSEVQENRSFAHDFHVSEFHGLLLQMFAVL